MTRDELVYLGGYPLNLLIFESMMRWDRDLGIDHYIRCYEINIETWSDFIKQCANANLLFIEMMEAENET